MLEDVPHIRRAGVDSQPDKKLEELLEGSGCEHVTFDEWKQIDALEIERGKTGNRPRVKFIDVDEMRRAMKKR